MSGPRRVTISDTTAQSAGEAQSASLRANDMDDLSMSGDEFAEHIVTRKSSTAIPEGSTTLTKRRAEDNDDNSDHDRDASPACQTRSQAHLHLPKLAVATPSASILQIQDLPRAVRPPPKRCRPQSPMPAMASTGHPGLSYRIVTLLGTIEPLLIRRVPNHKIRSTTLVVSDARDKIESYESPMYISIYLKFIP